MNPATNIGSGLLLLGAYGCQLRWRESTFEGALATVLRYTPDVCLLDVDLNGVKSYPIAEVLERLQVPFAFVTGSGDGALATPWQKHAILKKPFVFADMRTILDKLLL
jgi:FixJ family two-component response regulator